MDPKIRRLMSHSARILAEKFTEERNASSMLKIYQDLVENR
jgi:hypothetical protein